ncbi:MAG: hypothetical protein H0W83_01400 [Planctomycetes bacterium]|nr:hypothetical protein [Planctomycetota bacterium]
MDPDPDPGPEVETLVLAMPRRELFRIHGFVPPLDMAVLESVAEEAWYASPSVLVGSFDAKEVRVGVVVLTATKALVSEAGVLLHATPVPPEAGQMGTGLGALKNFSLAAARHLLGHPGGRIELSGFCNEDALPECRGVFILVYRLIVADDCPAPDGMEWVDRSGLGRIPLDPVSALVMDVAK